MYFNTLVLQGTVSHPDNLLPSVDCALEVCAEPFRRGEATAAWTFPTPCGSSVICSWAEAAPAAPGPLACGEDSTEDMLNCVRFSPCE